MTSRTEVLKSPVFEALKQIGHKPEDDIYTWSQGLGFHNQNLLNSLKENVKKPAIRKAILDEIWSFFYSVGLEKANKILGIKKKPDVAKINKVLAEIMNDKEHPAILGMGDFVEEAFLNWVKAFAIYDFAAYAFMEKHLGAKEALRIYMGLWEAFALHPLADIKKTFNIRSAADVDMDMLGRISHVYW